MVLVMVLKSPGEHPKYGIGGGQGREEKHIKASGRETLTNIRMMYGFRGGIPAGGPA